jgi:hypothetical protein
LYYKVKSQFIIFGAILQHEAVAVINDISNTINVAAANPTIGVLSSTTTSSRLIGSSYAASLSAGLHVDSSYLSSGRNAIVIDQHLLPVVPVFKAYRDGTKPGG